MKVSLHAIKVRRDAHTTTQVHVPEHEVPILETLFGAENVHNADGKPVSEHGVGKAVAEMEMSDDEFSRLSAKYGQTDEGPLVEQVYGKKATKGLEKAIEANGKKATKQGAKE